jgi:hypothetical protein
VPAPPAPPPSASRRQLYPLRPAKLSAVRVPSTAGEVRIQILVELKRHCKLHETYLLDSLLYHWRGRLLYIVARAAPLSLINMRCRLGDSKIV